MVGTAQELKTLTVRLIRETDNAAVKALLEAATEETLIQLKTEFQIVDIKKAYAYIRAGNFGMLAFLPDQEQPVGLIYARLHPTIYAGKDALALQIFGTVIHPRYHNPVAFDFITAFLLKELVGWVKAKESYNPLAILPYFYESKINTRAKRRISLAGGEPVGRYQHVTSLKTTNKPLPASFISTSSRVREATSSDLVLIAAGLNQFYAQHDLWLLQNEETLQSWLSPKEVEGQLLPLAKYYLIEDASGTPTAGIGVFDAATLYRIRVTKIPAFLNLLNQYVLKFIPPDEIIKPLLVSRVWYKPGNLELAKALVEVVRRQENSRGTNLVVSYDPSGPLSPLFKSLIASRSHLIGFNFPGYSPNQLLACYES